MLHFQNHRLPDSAERYLVRFARDHSPAGIKNERAPLAHFFRYLAQFKIPMDRLNHSNHNDFDEDLARHNLARCTRMQYLAAVNRFLRWLEDERELPAGTAQLMFPNYQNHQVKAKLIELPEQAKRFLEVLLHSNKPNTVAGYRSCLRRFYYLRSQDRVRRNPYDIARSDIESFLVYSHKLGNAPSMRSDRLIQLRRYLDWLYEHSKLKTHPDELIKAEDFPRPERLLPKPFEPATDLEIQKRLEARGDIDALGVLLMRRCGLRVGELRNLTIDCVQEDLNGNVFIKVPLGKLNNERIVPLDPKTVEVVERIKRHHAYRPEVPGGTVYLISGKLGKRRGTSHLGETLRDVCRDLHVPGKLRLHRLRHSFATSLLSAGLPLQFLKALLGHNDIRMTLGYAAVTQDALRSEYFTALSKVHARYETASFPLRAPDLRQGVLRGFYDTTHAIKKYSKEHQVSDPDRVRRLIYRLNMLRHEFSVALNLPQPTENTGSDEG